MTAHPMTTKAAASPATAPRIAIVRQRYNPSGGAERFVSRAIAALAGEVDVTLISRRWEAHAGFANVTVNPFYLGNVWRDWGFARGVRAAVAQGGFDLVQSHERIPGLDLYRAGDGVHREWLLQRQRARGAPARLSQCLNPYHAYVLQAERKMFEHPRLRGVICNSGMVRQDILRHFRIDPAKLHIIHSSIDTEAWHPTLRAAHRDGQRAQLGIPAEALCLVFVGSGFERKGLAVALQALAQARSRPHLIVVGRDKRARHYQQQAAQLGIADRVHFVGAQNEVKPFYAAADALIFPSLYEPFGNVNLEAMAMGLPLLASTRDGVAEWVKDDHNGYAHDPLDAAAFAASIDRLATPGKAHALGLAARQTVEPYTPTAMAGRLTALYRQLLSGGKTGD